MNADLFHDLLHLGQLAGLLLAMLVAGGAICQIGSAGLARPSAWLLTAGGAIAAERITADEPVGVRMVALVVALLWGMKCVVLVEYLADGKPRLTTARWLGFTTLWFGMRPGPFAAPSRAALPGAGRALLQGATEGLAGLTIFLVARHEWLQLPTGTSLPILWIVTLPALAGLSLMLHFGVFPLAVGLWRLAGIDARPLFRAPLASRSLSDFWGHRWNRGFPEMTALAVYRPLSGSIGKSGAMLAAFLFSGLLHEAAISVPVRAGYGLPLAYFALHAGLMLVERRLQRAGRPVESWGLWGRVWTLAWLLVPLPLLFHPWFVAGTVWPLFE